jgi:hypothetical protein
MTRAFVCITVSAVCAAAISCGLERPDHPDGRNELVLTAFDTSGVYGQDTIVAGAQVEVSSTTSDYKETFRTDAEGHLVLKNLPAGHYNVQATRKDDVSMVLLIGQKEEQLVNAVEKADTIYMSFMSSSPIVINEVYFAGCNASAFYFYDQFVELYNTTDETLYLDGYFVVRGTQADGIFDWDPLTSDVALGYYVFAFPGTRGVTHECPIQPKQYLVIASDAINHHNYGSLCVDLDNADWEFFNALGSDYDNPAVPNLTPVSIYTQDFTMNIGHSSVWLTTGESYTFQEHCYMSGQSMICSEYTAFPLSTILDGVEYSGDPPAHRYLSPRVDAATGGTGITRYSAKSIERKVPGLDTNNSSFDFERITPTPGYSHTRE